MNIVEYLNHKNKKICFCIVDDIATYENNWIREIIKNIADFTISNLCIKGYDVFVGLDEDLLLKNVSQSYKYAVVMSPGTEFINGTAFFNEIENLITNDFFIAGHVLDRGNAYYELHHQCYIINLLEFSNLKFPHIGKFSLGQEHYQIDPKRSTDNIHDNYTPLWISQGSNLKKFNHKCHGWNILAVALSNEKKILVFDDKIRNSKKHHYPESKKDFEEKISWIYYRQKFCETEYVHFENTESNLNNIQNKFDQIILPASGTLFLDQIDSGQVIFYDYNIKSLNYWQTHCIRKPNISYKFVHTDLLVDDELLKYIDTSAQKTLINLSNIFCYEGTAAFYPLSYRFQREKILLEKLNKIPNSFINFSIKSFYGFSKLDNPELSELIKPTWHFNQDWI